jgi:2-methylisocitrate lyase-like PEP mutase family enzyme
MTTPAEVLRDLHRQRPIVLPNVWDAASAKAVAAAGFPAMATSSGALVNALGHEDHEHAPVDEVLAAIARITRAVDVPVTADFEAGYGLAPEELVERLVDAGAAGCNLEDTDHARGEQKDPDEHAAWLGAVTDAAGGRLVVNARVDTYLGGTRQDEDAVHRARTYLAAGVDCTYPIGHLDEPTTARLVEAIPGPVNVLAYPGGPERDRLADLGVARISFGSSLFKAAMTALSDRLDEIRP